MKVSSVDYIKFDIEGSEYDAIKGAQNTLRKYHPVLAVSVYHKPDDLIELVSLICEICPGYNLAFRHHSPVPWEAVIYALPAVHQRNGQRGDIQDVWHKARSSEESA